MNFPFSDGTKFKVRPALIISGSRVNKTGDYLFIQLTSDRSWADVLAPTIGCAPE
ncbi:hypothetical protein J2I47_00890 [Fibrella sp. HMF5335]|uniref:mRNA interferase MazF n=1 Tax=Fibrella rubiginis TaxID=2817060 RepID=A0A939GCM4_9BACT|nr:hypothetical protein [Fibrella rubiginis]